MNKSKFDVIFPIASFLLSIIIFIFFISTLLSQNYASLSNKVLKFSIPYMNFETKGSSSTDESANISSFITETAGFDAENPFSILGKEINCFAAYNTSINFFKSGNIQDIAKIAPFNLGKSSVKTDADSNNDLKNKVIPSKPQVLIYHTHTCESYKPAASVDTMDQSKNVCAAGDALTDSLTNDYGVSVIHDKTVHDAYAYLKSYQNSGQTLDKYLKTYGDFDLIIDLHRDSIDNKNAVTIKINNENVASFRFVMAESNPHYDKNAAVVNKLIAISNKLYPNFCRGIFPYHVGTDYFNQAKSNHAFLIEVGSYVNTVDEAKASGKYLAKIFAEYLKENK